MAAGREDGSVTTDQWGARCAVAAAVRWMERSDPVQRNRFFKPGATRFPRAESVEMTMPPFPPPPCHATRGRGLAGDGDALRAGGRRGGKEFFRGAVGGSRVAIPILARLATPPPPLTQRLINWWAWQAGRQ